MNRTVHVHRSPVTATGQKSDVQEEGSGFEEVSARLRRKRTTKTQQGADKQDITSKSVVGYLPEEVGNCQFPRTPCWQRQPQNDADTQTDDKTCLGQSVPAALQMQCQLSESEGPSILAGLADVHQDGIFELLLPKGEKLAVAARMGKDKVSFLLYPANQQRFLHLTTVRRELESGLERQMDKQVSVTILPWQNGA